MKDKRQQCFENESVRQELAAQHPLTDKWWRGLSPSERVTIVVLMDVACGNANHYAPDLLEMAQNAISGYIGLVRGGHIFQLERRLEKNPNMTAQDVVNETCRRIDRTLPAQ